MELVSIVYAAVFALAGLAAARLLLPETRPLKRAAAGLSFGLALLMWLPALAAFCMGFTAAAQLAALAAAAALLFAAALLIRRREAGLPRRERFSLRGEARCLVSCLPLIVLIWALMLNHVITPASDGSLHSGQSTYGDMCMHLGFISSISAQRAFPPEYSILPGVEVGYPFLCDSVSSTFLTLGAGLRFAALLPMLYAGAAVVFGAYFLFETWLGRRAAPLATYMFFIGGGFGFAYFFDLAKAAGADSLYELMHGFYQTPTNQSELGLRWVNPIADMLVPQRATLFGWALLFPALTLLYRAAIGRESRLFYPLGVLAGLMPMVHTHSFLALGLVSLFLLAAECAGALRSPDPGRRGHILRFLAYGLIAAALAAPQLFAFTFRQAGEGGFLRLHFNWANAADSWLWFYVKNWGLVFILLVPAFLAARRESRLFFGGGAFIWAAAEFVVFQPNDYDNNKLLFVAWLLACGLVAEYLPGAWDRLRAGGDWPQRLSAGAAAVILCLALFTSGAMTLAREYVSGDHLSFRGGAHIEESGYQVASADHVAMAEWVRANTPEDAVFLTAPNHNNSIAMLTGRSIVCGSPSFLYYHGLDYAGRQEDVRRAYEQPETGLMSAAAAYGADYVLISSYELGEFDVDSAWFAENLREAYSGGECTLYEIAEN